MGQFQELKVDRRCETYEGEPPAFGHAMHKYFGFHPDYINLNHGSYGSLPYPVKRACDELTDRIESNPDKFLRFESAELLSALRARLARFIGAETDEVVVIGNASYGVNIVLRNFEWHEDDVLIGATTTYNSVALTLKYLSDVVPHPAVSVFQLHFPVDHATIVSRFREHIKSVVAQYPNRSDGPPRKFVAVIDAIVSNPGALLPWQEMVKICKEYGVYSVIDAAHSIGQEQNINLSKAEPDFWISNCHKWLFAKRPCAVLYVPRRNQDIIKSSFPTSHAYTSVVSVPGRCTSPSRFVRQFEWTSTIDFVPYLSAGPALDFREWLGGETKIHEYCHELALKGGKRLAELLGTSIMGHSEEITLNMVNVELPIPGSIKFSPEIDHHLRHGLLYGWNTYGAHFYHNGKWWTRCSTQIWNELSDFEYLARAFNTLSREIAEKFGGSAEAE